MTNLEIEDIRLVAELPYNWNILTNQVILISGGTGFIGSFLCDVIRYRNNKYNQNIKIISLSRHIKENDNTISYIKCDIKNKIEINQKVDYIIHLASNTHPEQYKNDPIGTITTNIFGTYNLLELAKEKNIKRFILASSCEAYGECLDIPVNEQYSGYINFNTARAGYNESKRLSESLCQSYYQQYNIESCICRLSRVFGADKTKVDSKAMAQFINNGINNEDIILKSEGNQHYSYVYVADAVSGIICTLLNGKACEAYNITSNNDSLCLKDYAEYISSLTNTKVVYDIENNPNASQISYSLLDNSKIKAIGFNPLFTTKEGIKRTIDILINN